MAYPKSRFGKRYIKKADLLRDLDAVLSALEDGVVVPNPDGSIVNNLGVIGVGILATDAQHGNRGGGTLHSTATLLSAGFLSPADKAKLDTIPAVASWTVTDWYIDGTIGNDANDGLTAGTPLKTGAELLGRLGSYAIWPQSVTIHVLANGMIDNLIVRGALLYLGTHVDVVGVPTVLATDVVSAFTNLVHATPVATLLTSTAIPDWTPYVGRRVTVTSGAVAGATMWIGAANPGGAGLQVAQVTRPARIDQTNVFSLVNTSSLAVTLGNNFQVETLPPVPSVMLLVDAAPSRTAGAQWPTRICTVQNIDCPEIAIRSIAVNLQAKALTFGCSVGHVDDIQQTMGSVSNLIAACNFTWVDPALALVQASNINGVHFCCLYSVSRCNVQFGQTLVAQYPLFQNCVCGVGFGSKVRLQDAQFWDYTGGSRVLQVDGEFYSAGGGISGARNIGYGIGASNNSVLTVLGTANVQASVANAALTTTPLVPLTLPQFLQRSDYAQKGTATLVAGTVTVTVPWWDPTTQKLTVSHANPLGIIGDLTAPTASQTNTQFTIDSLLATDISTVNWQISPLGRNILISTS